MEIADRSLNEKEAEIISKEICNTNNITGYSANELLKLGNMFVATESDAIAGVLLYKEYKKFIDLKILIVVEDYRGKGIGQQLFQKFITNIGDSKKITYTVTKSPQVISLVGKSGFKKKSFFALPPSAQMHQIAMVFNIYRIEEFFRKNMLGDKEKFSYWIRD